MPIDVTDSFHDKSLTEKSEEKKGEDVRFEHVEQGEFVFLIKTSCRSRIADSDCIRMQSLRETCYSL